MISQDFSWFQDFFLQISLSGKNRNSDQGGKKEVVCIVSKPVVSCLWECGESVHHLKLNIHEVQGLKFRNFQCNQFVEVGVYGPNNGSWRHHDDDDDEVQGLCPWRQRETRAHYRSVCIFQDFLLLSNHTPASNWNRLILQYGTYSMTEIIHRANTLLMEWYSKRVPWTQF